MASLEVWCGVAMVVRVERPSRNLNSSDDLFGMEEEEEGKHGLGCWVAGWVD